MIEQKDVIAFFDERAGEWDAGMVRSDEKIGRILDNAKVTAGSIAREKFPQENVRFVCGDAETAPLGEGFDAIVIYNAFPHFPDPERLVARLAALLAPGGRLTVAHGSSRADIDAHHHGAASRVSNGLMEAEALAAIFARHLRVTDVISTDEMYQVVGEKE